MKTATEGQEGGKRRGRYLALQRDHRQRGWSLNIETSALNVQRVTHVSSTSSAVTQGKWRPGRPGALADRDWEQLVSACWGRGGIRVRVAPEVALRWYSGCQHTVKGKGVAKTATKPEALCFLDIWLSNWKPVVIHQTIGNKSRIKC